MIFLAGTHYRVAVGQGWRISASIPLNSLTSTTWMTGPGGRSGLNSTGLAPAYLDRTGAESEIGGDITTHFSVLG